MAVSNLTLAALAAFLFEDTVNGAAVVQVKSGSTTIYEIDIDNTALAAVVFVKMWNATSGSVTLGTTDPDLIIRVPASTRIAIPIPAGLVFATALSVATVTAGGTGGVGAPATPPKVRIAYT
jgi:hypothetical protein